MSKILDSPLLTLDSSKPSGIATLCDELSASLRRPSRRTLALIDRALSYLSPFESTKASVVSTYERRDLLDLIKTHRRHLSPYLDLDRIESNLRR